MELPEICLATGIKILLGTWVGIKVSQRIYKMCKSLHAKRTSKFFSGRVEKCRSQVGKGSSIRTWRKSNVEIGAFAVQKEIKHKTTLPVVKDEIEENKYANQVYNDLDIDILEEKGSEVPNATEIIDNVHMKEIKLEKDAEENLVNVQDDLQNKNNFDDTEHLYNIQWFENNEKENPKSKELGFEKLDTENAQKMSDVEDTDTGNNSISHEIKDIDIDVDIKIEIDDKIKIPEMGFHWVTVKVPDDNFDNLNHEDVGFYEKEILTRIENQIIPVEIEDEIENYDIVLATEINENEEKLSKSNFITSVQTDSPLKQIVDNDTSDNDFRKSISQNVDIDKYIEGHQYKTVKVFLRKLSIPGVTRVSGNESILLNETLELDESQNMVAVKNTPSLLTVNPKKVAVNLDPLPSYMMKDMQLERRSPGTLKTKWIKAGRNAKSKLSIRKIPTSIEE